MRRISNLSNAPRKRTKSVSKMKNDMLEQELKGKYEAYQEKNEETRPPSGLSYDDNPTEKINDEVKSQENPEKYAGNDFSFRRYDNKARYEGIVPYETNQNNYYGIKYLFYSFIDCFEFRFRLRNLGYYWRSFIFIYITVYGFYLAYPKVKTFYNWLNDDGSLFFRVSPQKCYEFTRNVSLLRRIDHYLLSLDDYTAYHDDEVNKENLRKAYYDSFEKEEKSRRMERIQEEEMWRMRAKSKYASELREEDFQDIARKKTN
jgi:hypothetical protein